MSTGKLQASKCEVFLIHKGSGQAGRGRGMFTPALGPNLLLMAFPWFPFHTGLSSWRNSPSCQHPDCPAQPRAKSTSSEPANSEPDHGIAAGCYGNWSWRDLIPSTSIHQHRCLNPGDRWVVFCNASAYQGSNKELPVIYRITCLIFRDKATNLALIHTWGNCHKH